MDLKRTTIDSYDKTAKEYAAKTDGLPPSAESEKFLSLLQKGAKILDLGCGPGRDSKIFSEKGFDVTGIDLSKNMIALARQRARKAKFMVMDIGKLEFKPESFDAAWASAVFVHISKKNMQKTLSSLNRVLKTEGIVYLSMKEGEGEEALPDERYGGIIKFWNFSHLDEIKRVLGAAGFRVIESHIETKSNAYATNPFIH